MKEILLFGAGKSATVLIDYLLATAATENWRLLIVDADPKVAQSKLGNSPIGEAISFDISDDVQRRNKIIRADVVISLLPPALHFLVAKDCVSFSKNLLTASYVDEKINGLREEVEKNDLLFLCEMGLDPGIDHMSAMKIIDEIHEQGGTVTSFKSHCGGLVAPESDNNPWHYKISWNPRNIVLAGKAGAVFKRAGKTIQITYDKIFENSPELAVSGLPVLACYPNRDSTSYANLYGLETAPTFIRTTIRYPSFCRGWDVICHLGLTDTDDQEQIKKYKTVSEWFHQKLWGIELRSMPWLEYLNAYVDERWHTELTEQIDFLDLLEEKKIPANVTCSADLLQWLLETRLILSPGDQDMIVMRHEIEYSANGRQAAIDSTLVVKGEDNLRTAMAKTVGLPLGIAVRLLLKNKLSLKGIRIPIEKEIYLPVLKELETHGVIFHEQQKDL